MRAIHRNLPDGSQVGRKAVASFLVVLFASLQVLPQGLADSVPLAQEIQNQVPQVSVPQAVSSEPTQVPETSIDFLQGSESALSAPEPISLPSDPIEPPKLGPVPEPITRPEPEVPLERPPDPSLLEIDPLTTGELIEIEPPIPQQELIPVGPPLEWDQPFSGNAGAYFEVIRSLVMDPALLMDPERAVAIDKLTLIKSFHLSDEEAEQAMKDVKLVSVEKKSWPSPCSVWGEPLFTIACIQVIVNGYQVVLELYGNTYEFRRGTLDPAKAAAISAINHLMEHGTPKVPWSNHMVHPKLFQIKIGDIVTRKYFKDGYVSEVFFDIDLKVQLNRRRSVSWRYTVDAKTNEVLGRKLYSPFRPHHLPRLIDYDQKQAIERAKKNLIEQFVLSEEEANQALKHTKLVSVEKKTWPNPGVGWGGGLSPFQVIVTGYQVVLELYGNTYEFHAGRLDPAKEAAIVAINELLRQGNPPCYKCEPTATPKLSQIEIAEIQKLSEGYWKDHYQIDLNVRLGHGRFTAWRFWVDRELNPQGGAILWEKSRFKRDRHNRDLIQIERPDGTKLDYFRKVLIRAFTPEGHLVWFRKDGNVRKIRYPDGRVLHFPRTIHFTSRPPLEKAIKRLENAEHRAVIHLEQRTVPAES